MEILTIQNLSFSYPEQDRKAIDNFSLSVEQGEFLVICGPSGCGKSTLLRQLKSVLTPHGTRSGMILMEGTPLEEITHREQSQRIGFVLQSPENQVVTDKVWHELAFGLESLGYDTPTIRRRVAEMASFFGIEDWFHKSVSELSGGQKQLMNLASVMAMQPSVLILDEPTSQLDPIAAADFLSVLSKINRELGTTIILSEHRLEDALPLATRVAVMEEGRLLCFGTAQEVGTVLKQKKHPMFLAMPAAMRIWSNVESKTACPVTVREGRNWLADFAAVHGVKEVPPKASQTCFDDAVISAKDLWFKYKKDSPDVVKGLSMTVKRGEFLALLGGNGTGKTTSLKLIAGLLKPYRGEVSANGSIGVLPQNPQTLFLKKTVREDLHEILSEKKIAAGDCDARVARVVRLCRLEQLLDRHPYDLSGGEQQRAALAKILLLEPQILLLDEPTKGLDAEFKLVFAEILKVLLNRGISVLMVSHDIEFCARYAHRCALFFDGGIVTDAPPQTFFSGNSFYTTSANRIARTILPCAVTPEDVIIACGGQISIEIEPFVDDEPLSYETPTQSREVSDKLPWWRKLLAVISGGGALALFVHFIKSTDMGNLRNIDRITGVSADELLIYGIFIVLLFIFAFAINRKSNRADYVVQIPKQKRKLRKRTIIAAVLILLLIPITLFIGEAYLGGRKYYFISLMIMLEIMIPFFLVFEGRKPQARELVIIAVLCAISVAGRAALFMLPQFKPVIAMTIIAGVAFGGETGFLVGAMTMLASNVMFSQGPWTPWQMFAMGIIGFIAGVLFRKGLLRRTRGALCVFGALATILIYGGIMNPASALMSSNELNWKIILAYYISGFPVDCVQAAATWIFLWFAAEPMLEKLDRVKVKYGLVE